jgi:hypothetical protein
MGGVYSTCWPEQKYTCTWILTNALKISSCRNSMGLLQLDS